MQTNKQTNKQASNPANIDTIKVLGNHKPTCMRTEVRKQDARTRRGRERDRERERELERDACSICEGLVRSRQCPKLTEAIQESAH